MTRDDLTEVWDLNYILFKIPADWQQNMKVLNSVLWVQSLHSVNKKCDISLMIIVLSDFM